jgi:3-deoxy-D-manno-octulosonic acid hydroxylase-like protein
MQPDRFPTPVIAMPIVGWDGALAPEQQAAALAAVESGAVLLFEKLAFSLAPEESRFLSPRWSDAKAKNISFDPAKGTVKGARGTHCDVAGLSRMIERFAGCAHKLVGRLFPDYARAACVARTSFRPMPADDRETSWRKDDRRLHVDAFPSRPNHGARILRVFNNVNPSEPRLWRVGEPFEDMCARFLPRVAAPVPGVALLLATLHVTKGMRSRYDHIMLQLHDGMKADATYQLQAPQAQVAFPPGSTWVCFSDQVSHAVMRGQYLLEQTLQLPLAAMRDPGRAPLRVLERLEGRTLA